MALERVPSDIELLVALRMANPKIVEEVMNAVSIQSWLKHVLVISLKQEY